MPIKIEGSTLVPRLTKTQARSLEIAANICKALNPIADGIYVPSPVGSDVPVQDVLLVEVADRLDSIRIDYGPTSVLDEASNEHQPDPGHSL